MAFRCKAILLVLLGLILAAGTDPSVAGAKSDAGSSTIAPPAVAPYRMAQLKLNIGLSKDDARRLLFQNGFREIQIARETFKNVHAEACLRGLRYRVKVRRLSGKVIRGDQIGRCRPTVDAQQVAAILRRQGLDKISVSPIRQGRFVAKACDFEQRVRLDIDPYGEVLQRSITGRCQRGPNIAEIRQQLRQDGFTKIQIVNRNQGRLVAEACFEGDKFRLRLAANGRIQRRTVIGSCARPIGPQNIAQRLRDLGYRQIKVIDNQLPVYQAEACRQNSMLRIRMNRFGEVTSTSRLGRCSPPLTRQQVVTMLQKRGANRVEILSSNNRGFRARACYRLEKREYRIDPYGAVLDRTVVGRCPQAPRLNSVLKDFRSRGIRNLQIFVEGCRKGRRLQIELNQYGDEINRQRIGRC